MLVSGRAVCKEIAKKYVETGGFIHDKSIYWICCTGCRENVLRATVLGAGGFLGINLVHALVAAGWEVLCFDRCSSVHWPPGVEVLQGDFLTCPPELLQGLDTGLVFHLISACRPHPDTVLAAAEVEADVAATLRVLDATKHRPLRWVFLSSGGTVYGEGDVAPLREDRATVPICSYGLVKLMMEQSLALHRYLHGLDYVVVRLANPYGPHQLPLTGQGLIATLLYRLMTGGPVEVWGDGENVRDYLFIDDAIAGILAAARAGEGGQIYNVGTGLGTTINQLIDLAGTTVGRRPDLRYCPPRDVDVRCNFLDSAKLAGISGWSPQVTLPEGLLRTVDWLRQCGELPRMAGSLDR